MHGTSSVLVLFLLTCNHDRKRFIVAAAIARYTSVAKRASRRGCYIHPRAISASQRLCGGQHHIPISNRNAHVVHTTCKAGNDQLRHTCNSQFADGLATVYATTTRNAIGRTSNKHAIGSKRCPSGRLRVEQGPQRKTNAPSCTSSLLECDWKQHRSMWHAGVMLFL